MLKETAGPANPARLASDVERTDWRDTEENEPTNFLSVEDREKLIESVKHVPAHLNVRANKLNGITWRYARSRAIVSLCLGAGAKVSELLNLSVSCISPIGARRTVDFSRYFHNPRDGAGVPAAQDALHAFRGKGQGAQRVVTMPSWCTTAVDDWLMLHEQEALTLLFPTKPGGVRMNPSTVARKMAEWSLLSEVTITAQLLRNTFGAILIESGCSNETLARLMGFADTGISTYRLRDQHKAWQMRALARGRKPADT